MELFPTKFLLFVGRFGVEDLFDLVVSVMPGHNCFCYIRWIYPLFHFLASES